MSLRHLALCALAATVMACDAGAGELPGAASAPAAQPAPSASSALGAPGSSSAASVAASIALASGAATSTPAPSTAPAAPVFVVAPEATSPAATLTQDLPRPHDGKGAGFVGPVDVALDAAWITRLAAAGITEITPNRGGGSISMKVRFADGKKAVMKPEQTGKPTDPRAEIAAYHLDRLLGFGRTAAVVGRRFALAEVRAALVASGADAAFLERIDKLLVVRDGKVDAAMIAWHTAPLVEEESAPAWMSTLDSREAVPAESLSKLSEWSDLVVFDFLIDNPDRYSGGNILRLGKNGPLVFLDQGAAFGRNRLRDKLTTVGRLDKICRFRKATLAALRHAGAAAPAADRLGAALGASLARDPIAPVLAADQLEAIDERVASLAGHVGSCEARVGAPAVSLAASKSP